MFLINVLIIDETPDEALLIPLLTKDNRKLIIAFIHLSFPLSSCHSVYSLFFTSFLFSKVKIPKCQTRVLTKCFLSKCLVCLLKIMLCLTCLTCDIHLTMVAISGYLIRKLQPAARGRCHQVVPTLIERFGPSPAHSLVGGPAVVAQSLPICSWLLACLLSAAPNPAGGSFGPPSFLL